jgi:hypothetical protein
MVSWVRNSVPPFNTAAFLRSGGQLWVWVSERVRNVSEGVAELMQDAMDHGQVVDAERGRNAAHGIVVALCGRQRARLASLR